MKMKQSEYKEASIKGNYMNQCCICKATIINADKRCYSCKDCDEMPQTMKRNEVVETLNTIKNGYTETGKTFVLWDRVEAITHAIRCVELMPELVETLQNLIDEFGYSMPVNNVETVTELLKKSKGLIE